MYYQIFIARLKLLSMKSVLKKHQIEIITLLGFIISVKPRKSYLASFPQMITSQTPMEPLQTS